VAISPEMYAKMDEVNAEIQARKNTQAALVTQRIKDEANRKVAAWNALRSAMRLQEAIVSLVELGQKGRLSPMNAELTVEQIERDLVEVHEFVALMRSAEF